MRDRFDQENSPGVSIIICCYNSADRIIPTLEYASRQHTGSEIDWELVLVDNGCVDETVNVAKNTWDRLKVSQQLRIVRQPVAGLSHARQKGVEEAKFQYIIFCDDDNWLAENYIETTFHILEQNPDIGIAGGHSDGATDGEFPDWFSVHENAYAVGTPYKTITDVTGFGVWGAGMISRKSLMLKIFDERFPFLCLDRNKEQLSSGGDGEICLRAALLGYRVVFYDTLKFTHYIPVSRLNIQYKDRLIDSFTDAAKFTFSYIRLWKISKIKGFERIKFAFFSFCKLLLGYITLSRVRILHNREYLYFITGFPLFAYPGNKEIRTFYNAFLS